MTRVIGSVDRIRWLTALGAALCGLLATVALHQWQPPAIPSGPSLAMPAASGSSAALDPRIAAIAARRPDQTIEAIVQFDAAVTPQRARWMVGHVHGQVAGELHIINALVVRLAARDAQRLAARTGVHAVSLNGTVRTQGDPADPRRGPSGGVNTTDLQTTYDQTLNATALWQRGFDGAGVGVAVIDTGIDGNLPDFKAPGPGEQSRVVESAVTNPGALTAYDGYGHGTDVAGIIAGDGDNLAPSDPLKGNYIGVAPAADLVSIKVSDDRGNATVLDVIYGLQFAVDHQSDYNIRVVNLSLDSQTPQSYTTDPLDAAVEAAWMHGIVVVAAAGNGGEGSASFAPANDPYVITVGAVDENGTADPTDDFVPGWSSQGTTQDGFQKPDVYAPGAHIVSVLAPLSAFAMMCRPCVIGDKYIRTSGTSMAAPMISGLVADLVQAHPTWTPDQLKGALTSPAVASNPSLQEVDAAKVMALTSPPVADSGLTPNQLIDPTTGGIDYTRSSWSRSSWSLATGSLSAGFARSSWSCTCADVSGAGNGVGPTRSSWSRSSWSIHLDPTSATG